MSIRMLVLHDAHDGTEFRMAAHNISFYQPSPLGFTTINGIICVKETMEELDRFYDIDRLPLPANEDFESDEPVLHT